MKRRTVLKMSGLYLLSPALNKIETPAPEKRKALRVAHLTDIHLKDQFGAPGKFVKCLHHLQRQNPGVDLVLNGGDIVFDMNKENIGTIDAQWTLSRNIMGQECSLPVRYCLGNHDIWWNEDDRGQALYGKKFAMDQLGLSKAYYSFENSGWKFIILDSVHLDVDGTWYIGKLGEKQFSWLENELKATGAGTPVLVMSHIPILTATLMVEDNIVNKWEMLGGDMHTDTARIISLFFRHPNVKLCLSGHIHLRDKVLYNNVTYICNGAVSGAWWEGSKRETAPGYGLIDLFDDGSFQEAYVNY